MSKNEKIKIITVKHASKVLANELRKKTKDQSNVAKHINHHNNLFLVTFIYDDGSHFFLFLILFCTWILGILLRLCKPIYVVRGLELKKLCE